MHWIVVQGWVAVWVALVALQSLAVDSTLQYEAVDNNVSYASVQALPVLKPASIHRYGDAPQQFGELWLPAAKKQHPLLVFIHGGCWLNAFDIQHSHALSSALQSAGFAVWSLEYRRIGDPGGAWPGTFDDIRAGMQLIARLPDERIDKSRVLIAGHSAGGHLALWYGSEYSKLEDKPFELKGIVGLAPIVDVERYALGDNSCQKATPQLFHGGPAEFPQRYRRYNPVHLATAVNTEIIQGDADRIIPPAQFRQSLFPVTLLKGAGHFDMIHPGSPAFREFLQTAKRLSQYEH